MLLKPIQGLDPETHRKVHQMIDRLLENKKLVRMTSNNFLCSVRGKGFPNLTGPIWFGQDCDHGVILTEDWIRSGQMPSPAFYYVIHGTISDDGLIMLDATRNPGMEDIEDSEGEEGEEGKEDEEDEEDDVPGMLDIIDDIFGPFPQTGGMFGYRDRNLVRYLSLIDGLDGYINMDTAVQKAEFTNYEAVVLRPHESLAKIEVERLTPDEFEGLIETVWGMMNEGVPFTVEDLN